MDRPQLWALIIGLGPYALLGLAALTGDRDIMQFAFALALLPFAAFGVFIFGALIIAFWKEKM